MGSPAGQRDPGRADDAPAGARPRLRLLWLLGFVAAIVATAVTILAYRNAAAVVTIMAVLVLAIWLTVDLRPRAATPVRRAGPASASVTSSVPIRREDELVIRASLQTVTRSALCAALIV